MQSDDTILIIMSGRCSGADILRIFKSRVLVRLKVNLLSGLLVVAIYTRLSGADNADAHASLAADGLVVGRRLVVAMLVRSSIVERFSSLALLLVDLEFNDGFRADARL